SESYYAHPVLDDNRTQSSLPCLARFRPRADLGRIEMPHCGKSLLLTNLLCSDLGLGQRMQFGRLKRRDFIAVIGGAAAWPLAARAQQPERMRSIGVLMSIAPDREGQACLTAFLQALQGLGWTEGLNVRIETRWGAGNLETIRKFAA